MTRIYLEVATKFVRNIITLRTIRAAQSEAALNTTNGQGEFIAPKPLDEYCPNAEFEYQDEGAPAGTTHIARGSFRKFKFGDSDKVFLQAEMTAADKQPADTCANPRRKRALRSLQEGPPGTDLDLSPVYGNLYSPPISMSVSRFDTNALSFPPVPDFVSALPAPVVPAGPTDKAIQIESEVTLPLSATWAVANRRELEATLRTTLQLLPNEDLVITKITAARRGLAPSTLRLLQAAGVKIEFVVGVSDKLRAQTANSALTALSQGEASVVQQFSLELDQNLQRSGKNTVSLPVSALSFKAPVATVTATGAGAALSLAQSSGNDGSVSESVSKSSDDDADTTTIMILVFAFIGTSMIMIWAGLACGIVVKEDETGKQYALTVTKYKRQRKEATNTMKPAVRRGFFLKNFIVMNLCIQQH